MNDEFELYDLRVEVLDTGKPFVSHARPGDTFDVIGGRIVFPPGREASFSLYAMMAVLPFLIPILVTILILIATPPVATWLPRAVGY